MNYLGMGKGRRIRVREKIRNAGVDALSDHEVLELLLYPFVPRKDTGNVGRMLMQKFGSLDKVFNASASELLSVKGVPEFAAIYLSIYKIMIERTNPDTETSLCRIECESDLDSFCFELFSDSDVPKTEIFFLDTDNRIIRHTRYIYKNMEATANLIVRESRYLNAKNVICLLSNPMVNIENLSTKENIDAINFLAETINKVNLSLIDFIMIGMRADRFSFHHDAPSKSEINQTNEGNIKVYKEQKSLDKELIKG